MSHLTYEQRYTISVMLQSGYTQSKIAQTLNRDKSVISRELKRNCNLQTGNYSADLAHRKCTTRHVKKPKHKKLTPEIRAFIIEKLEDKLSPEQIVGYCKQNGIACVSHQWIYHLVWENKRRNGKLCKNLRSRGKPYKKRGEPRYVHRLNKKSISQRPAVVEQRRRIGDLEIDTVLGKHKRSALITINDRATGVVKIGKVSGRKSEPVTAKTIEMLHPWKGIVRTITGDNGAEFASFKEIENSLNIDFYFAEPYKSWQRGSNENLNRLIRQYFPKGTDFDNISEQNIMFVQNQLNQRPRKRFGFRTPDQMFNQMLHL